MHSKLHKQILETIDCRSKQAVDAMNKIEANKSHCKELCYYYEGQLSALQQTISDLAEMLRIAGPLWGESLAKSAIASWKLLTAETKADLAEHNRTASTRWFINFPA